MTTIFDLWERVNFITDKYRNGYVSPDEVSQALDAGQQALYAYYLPLKERGDDIATTALIPFKVTDNLTTDSSGVLAYPDNYGNTEAIYKTINGKTKSIRVVLHEELEYALNSYVYPIATNPRYLEDQPGIQIYPQTTHTVELHYLSRPTTPVIGYTVAGNEVVYDPLTSVQLQFDNNYWMDILLKGLPYIGVNLSDQEVAALTVLFNQNKTS